MYVRVCFADDSVLPYDWPDSAPHAAERAPGLSGDHAHAPPDDLQALRRGARCVDPVPIGDPDEDEGYDDDEEDDDDYDDEEDDEEPMHLAGA